MKERTRFQAENELLMEKKADGECNNTSQRYKKHGMTL